MVTITYQGSTIATMEETGAKTLLTASTFCDDNIIVEYTAPSGPSGTKSISISANGTTTEDVTDYANVSITVAVPQPSGSTTVTDNGTYNISQYATVVVAIPSASGVSF